MRVAPVAGWRREAAASLEFHWWGHLQEARDARLKGEVVEVHGYRAFVGGGVLGGPCRGVEGVDGVGAGVGECA